MTYKFIHISILANEILPQSRQLGIISIREIWRKSLILEKELGTFYIPWKSMFFDPAIEMVEDFE